MLNCGKNVDSMYGIGQQVFDNDAKFGIDLRFSAADLKAKMLIYCKEMKMKIKLTMMWTYFVDERNL